MKYKKTIEIALFLLVCFLIFFFYFKYFNQNSSENNFDNENLKKDSVIKKDEKNTITNLYYENYDLEGNRYVIMSKTGVLNDINTDQIFMNEVNAFIELNKGGKIDLVSDKAEYNMINSDTNFVKNVELTYLKHKVYADNIDVLFEASKLNAYNNLVYKNFDLNLIADKVEIDLISKDTKISNFDDTKIKIFKKK
jgi:hypothetical protein